MGLWRCGAVGLWSFGVSRLGGQHRTHTPYHPTTPKPLNSIRKAFVDDVGHGRAGAVAVEVVEEDF